MAKSKFIRLTRQLFSLIRPHFNVGIEEYVFQGRPSPCLRSRQSPQTANRQYLNRRHLSPHRLRETAPLLTDFKMPAIPQLAHAICTEKGAALDPWKFLHRRNFKYLQRNATTLAKFALRARPACQVLTERSQFGDTVPVVFKSLCHELAPSGQNDPRQGRKRRRFTPLFSPLPSPPPAPPPYRSVSFALRPPPHRLPPLTQPVAASDRSNTGGERSRPAKNRFPKRST